MARHSIFKKLPKQLTKLFHSLLDEDRYTHAQIVDLLNEYLAEAGEEPIVTRRVVQYTAQNYAEQVAKACGEARREALIAEKTIAELGGKPNTDQSKALGMILQTLNMRVGVEMMRGEALPTTKELRELNQSKKINDEACRITEILIKQAKAQAAEDAAAAMKANGIDEETIRTVERVIVKANG